MLDCVRRVSSLNDKNEDYHFGVLIIASEHTELLRYMVVDSLYIIYTGVFHISVTLMSIIERYY